ncbi:MAG: sigma-70 family RNA polymerase sigma factor, partial [Coriobacteriia bacterium]|nr:sigma-70 family RNA polymerase sigma factor [Coriobacteriia bacterium]
MWRELFVLTYRHLRSRGASHADAEEITQEVLMAAYINIEGIDPDKLSAWLRAAARNKMVDLYRRPARAVALDRARAVEDPGESPEAAALRADESAKLRGVIANLPPRDAHLLEQYYLDERPLSQIARECDISMTAAKVALFRARQRLKKAL